MWGLLLLGAVSVAQGAAVIDESLRQDEQRRVVARDTGDLKAILETDQPESVAAAVGAQSFARLRHRVGRAHARRYLHASVLSA